MNASPHQFDVVIAGAGPVGAAAAVALGRAGQRVLLVEPSRARGQLQPGYDGRPLALAFGSRRLLEALGLWDALAHQASPILNIHVSDRGRFGFVRLGARDYDVPALGYVVEAKRLGEALAAALETLESVTIARGRRIESVRSLPDTLRLELAGANGDDKTATCAAAKLAVAADGRRSPLRGLGGIGARDRDYHQVAVTAVVTPQCPPEGWAYERFTRSGPLALLPLVNNQCGLVWTLAPGDASAVHALDDRAFLNRLERCFGSRLGAFVDVRDRAHYPLGLTRSDTLIGERLAIIGNAANNLHPVAGQGLNLGLRDMAALAQLFVEHQRAGRDPGARRCLREYERWRRADQRAAVWFTDTLIDVFAQRSKVLGAARDIGLVMCDAVPALKRALALRAMGLAGRQPRLCRGLAL